MTESTAPGPNKARSHQGDQEADASETIDPGFMVVGIGASAGGLDACYKLFDALPSDSGMVFILVQHLDPSHESMMVDLLARHTAMQVRQAENDLQLERGHVYVIPPGSNVSVDGEFLRLSPPQVLHGARLPFDFLLRSLAQEFGARAAAVILSGTGADGSLGLKVIKEKGGLVIAQSPGEAGFDGMPRNAIATGAVDLVLPVAEIPDALAQFGRRMTLAAAHERRVAARQASDWLPEVIDLLRTRTAHDFTQYKPGTMQRRTERRMALASIESDDINRYLEKLHSDPDELELLAKDLLINVTSFFRDASIFDYLEKSVVPDLVSNHGTDRPLRIWIAGCSTGEESYSLAMLFHDQITASKRSIKLQVFASDVDADAVAQAREGLYPESIEAVVSPERLKRFFRKEGHCYRVLPSLRESVVFTVQDMLSDPPFSRLDFVSCRNLLIYLRPEAQSKVISIFKFALRVGGVLLLGGSESIGAAESGFEIISKPERVYRRVGDNSRSEFASLLAENSRGLLRAAPGFAQSKPLSSAQLCERLVIEKFAPPAVLINRKQECLYTLGEIDRFLRLAPGSATHDLIASSRDFVRSRLRSVVQKAWQKDTLVAVRGRPATGDTDAAPFRIEASPTTHDGEKLMLVCFIDEVEQEAQSGTAPKSGGDATRLAELEQELDDTRAELESAIRSLEISVQEQQAINEEALSVNEEYQSTNEELETSKEELQSLNEELTALNSQLQEALELQRTAADDLQNVLYSTDVATIFLDTDLRIRVYTPAVGRIFHIIPSDVGRSLSDLNPRVADPSLLSDAGQVMRTQEPIDREIGPQDGSWYSRSIFPYRTRSGDVEGVVITFIDVTEQRRISAALAAANEEAQRATVAKSRFLAMASHDLRQPLQTLVFLQGLLAKQATGSTKQDLVVRMGETVQAMSRMLNVLLDLNQIEANAVQVEVSRFPVNDLLVRLHNEFSYQAKSQGLDLRMVSSRHIIESDPRLLEQMMRNLLSNALKYTKQGKVLFGCRRRNGRLRLEVWDTGAGIPESELQSVFEEYHQLNNVERELSRGFGLGLSIVRRLGALLEHNVDIQSEVGKGSVFSVEVGALPPGAPYDVEIEQNGDSDRIEHPVSPTEHVLVVEDNRDVRELLDVILTEEGYRVASAQDGPGALELVSSGRMRPDILLADFTLPNGMNGARVATELREVLQREIPVVLLTGDISVDSFRNVALENCTRLHKPVDLDELTRVIRRLLPPSNSSGRTTAPSAAGNVDADQPNVFVIDDDRQIREGILSALGGRGWKIRTYSDCESFLKDFRPGQEACLLVDCRLPGMDGFELMQQLRDQAIHLPAVMITGYGDVPTAVRAMKAGAMDFVEKPIPPDALVAVVQRALEASRNTNALVAQRETAENRVASLTPRQREVLDLVLAGHPSKNIAADLGISQRTVENHRAAIMKATGAKSLPELARLVVIAG